MLKYPVVPIVRSARRSPSFLAYFNGYAMWTYLTTPFFMAMPGFTVEEISPWQEGHELWRGLRVRFPDYIASHSPEQDFYFGDDFLLRRHDYQVDVAGGFAAAQYVHDIVEVEGFRLAQPARARLAIVKHAGIDVLPRSARRGIGPRPA